MRGNPRTPSIRGRSRLEITSWCSRSERSSLRLAWFSRRTMRSPSNSRQRVACCLALTRSSRSRLVFRSGRLARLSSRTCSRFQSSFWLFLTALRASTIGRSCRASTSEAPASPMSRFRLSAVTRTTRSTASATAAARPAAGAASIMGTTAGSTSEDGAGLRSTRGLAGGAGAFATTGTTGGVFSGMRGGSGGGGGGASFESAGFGAARLRRRGVVDRRGAAVVASSTGRDSGAAGSGGIRDVSVRPLCVAAAVSAAPVWESGAAETAAATSTFSGAAGTPLSMALSCAVAEPMRGPSVSSQFVRSASDICDASFRRSTQPSRTSTSAERSWIWPCCAATSTSSMACATFSTASRPTIRAAPLSECAARIKGSMVAGVLPVVSSASRPVDRVATWLSASVRNSSIRENPLRSSLTDSGSAGLRAWWSRRLPGGTGGLSTSAPRQGTLVGQPPGDTSQEGVREVILSPNGATVNSPGRQPRDRDTRPIPPSPAPQGRQKIRCRREFCRPSGAGQKKSRRRSSVPGADAPGYSLSPRWG